MATSVTLKPNAIDISGSTSGTTTLQASAVAGTTTLTLPAATDTLVGKATTDTLTNKTLTGAAMNGTLGATTPSTASVTTLTTSSTVTHSGGTANGVAYLDGSKVLTTGSALVFDGTNLGVGVTPPTVSGGTYIWNRGGATLSDGLGQSYYGSVLNAAYNSGWKYVSNGYAAYYVQDSSGNHNWVSAPSGTAGNAISFTQVLNVAKGKSLALEGATSQTGTGITFPATQSASTDANTLDDYEEGTWTPSVGGNATYTIQSGTYVKVGQLVTAWFDIQINVIGTGATTTMSGLPFTSRVSPTNPQGMSGVVGYFNALANGITNIFVRVDNNSTSIALGNSDGSNNTTLQGVALFQNGSRITGTLTYQANA